jgi:hypothetical protein
MVRGRLGSAPPAAVSETHFAITEAPEQIHVIVAGGPGKHSAWMPTFGAMTRPATVGV